MLVDLGRNDVGRVARDRHASRSPSAWSIERYSHVMHLVSNVRGAAAPRAATASTPCARPSPPARSAGAPKIRAMEIIEELEPVRRGVYGGAVGYFGYSRQHGHLRSRSARVRDARRRASTCRRAPASSPTPIPRREHASASTRRARWSRRCAWRSGCDGRACSDDRQLRLVHLQPRPVPRRARRGRRACAATTRSRSTRSPRSRPTASSSRPGPCTPNEAGISVPLDPALRRARSRSSASASATRRSARRSAATIVRAPRIMHGKTSPIHHDGQGVFAGLPNPFEATRYHSLVIERGDAARRARASRAWTAEGEIMGVRHRTLLRRGRAVPPRVDPDARGQAPARATSSTGSPARRRAAR